MKREKETHTNYFFPFEFFFYYYFRNKIFFIILGTNSCSLKGRTNHLLSAPGKWEMATKGCRESYWRVMFPTQIHSPPEDSSWSPNKQHEARPTGSADLWDLEPLCGPKQGRKLHPSAPPGLHQPFTE